MSIELGSFPIPQTSCFYHKNFQSLHWILILYFLEFILFQKTKIVVVPFLLPIFSSFFLAEMFSRDSQVIGKHEQRFSSFLLTTSSLSAKSFYLKTNNLECMRCRDSNANMRVLRFFLLTFLHWNGMKKSFSAQERHKLDWVENKIYLFIPGGKQIVARKHKTWYNEWWVLHRKKEDIF